VADGRGGQATLYRDSEVPAAPAPHPSTWSGQLYDQHAHLERIAARASQPQQAAQAEESWPVLAATRADLWAAGMVEAHARSARPAVPSAQAPAAHGNMSDAQTGIAVLLIFVGLFCGVGAWWLHGVRDGQAARVPTVSAGTHHAAQGTASSGTPQR
jgi:hypothetical protein